MNVRKMASLLWNAQKTIAVAESCTGGLIAHTLTNVGGSSRYFITGFIVYSNKAKAQFLRIPPKKIVRFGAVSQQIAVAMAKNVRVIAGTKIGLATTGIAGPDGGTKKKPVGTVYIALATTHATMVKRFSFRGSRIAIKKKTTNAALRLLEQCLENQ